MKILQINSTKTFGGGERHFVDLCKGLQNKGHEVFVAIRPNCEWKEKVKIFSIIELPLKNSFDIASAIKLAKFIKTNEIEIVHAHAARDYTIASLAVRIAKRAKFILTRHVLFPIKSAFLLKNVSKVIAVSNAVEVELKKSFPTEKIVKIYNGINFEKFEKTDYEKHRREFRFENNIPFDAFLITTIGELKELKGQQDFVLASKIIAEKFPNAHFAIIGKDNSITKEFRSRLKRLVKVFDLEKRYLWLDWVEDTASLLHATDIFVSASHTESFGLAILEAIASQTCVVATKTEGAKEFFDEKDLVEIGNQTQLAEKICEFLEYENKRLSFSKDSLTKAKVKFSLEKMIAETEQIYLKSH
jgi:glycosyltransferase involved in cell wall biosynthesis